MFYELRVNIPFVYVLGKVYFVIEFMAELGIKQSRFILG